MSAVVYMHVGTIVSISVTALLVTCVCWLIECCHRDKELFCYKDVSIDMLSHY